MSTSEVGWDVPPRSSSTSSVSSAATSVLDLVPRMEAWECALCKLPQSDEFCVDCGIYKCASLRLTSFGYRHLLGSPRLPSLCGRRYSGRHHAVFSVQRWWSLVLLSGLKVTEGRSSKLASKYLTPENAIEKDWVWLGLWQSEKCNLLSRDESLSFIVGDTEEERVQREKQMIEDYSGALVGFIALTEIKDMSAAMAELSPEQLKYFDADNASIKYRYKVLGALLLLPHEVVRLPKGDDLQPQPKIWETGPKHCEPIDEALAVAKPRKHPWIKTPDVMPKPDLGGSDKVAENNERVIGALEDLNDCLNLRLDPNEFLTPEKRITKKGIAVYLEHVVEKDDFNKEKTAILKEIQRAAQSEAQEVVDDGAAVLGAVEHVKGADGPSELAQVDIDSKMEDNAANSELRNLDFAIEPAAVGARNGAQKRKKKRKKKKQSPWQLKRALRRRTAETKRQRTTIAKEEQRTQRNRKRRLREKEEKRKERELMRGIVKRQRAQAVKRKAQKSKK